MKNLYIFSQKMYLEADFWLRYCRRWVKKVYIIISLQLIYTFLILPSKFEKKIKLKTAELSHVLQIFYYDTLPLFS